MRLAIDEDHLRRLLEGGRVFWVMLAVFEAVNALDWLSTVVGVAALGLREQTPAVLGLIRQLGPFWGVTVHKALVGLAYVPVAALGSAIARSRRAAPGALWIIWGMGVATGVMAQVVLMNAWAIGWALLGRRP